MQIFMWIIIIINIDINNSSNIYFLVLVLVLLVLLLLIIIIITINEITVETSCYFRAEQVSLDRSRVLSRHATLFPNKGGGALRDETKMAARACCTVPQLYLFNLGLGNIPIEWNTGKNLKTCLGPGFHVGVTINHYNYNTPISFIS